MSSAQQKRREQELFHSQAYLASVVESATDAIITIDSSQNIVLFNAAAEKMFRCSTEQTLGKPITQFIPQSFRKQHIEWVRGFGEGTVALRRMGPLGEVAGLRADDSRFLAEVSISKCAVNGELFFTAILRDITERKRAAEELRAGEERFRKLFKSLPIPTYSWQWRDGDFVLVDFSDAAGEATAGRISTVLGATAGQVFAGHLEIAEDLRRCYEEKHTIRREFVYKFARTGRIANIDATYVFVPPDIVVAHTFDITERKATENTLIKLSNVAEQTADSIIITDRDGVIEYVNPALEKLTGYTAAEVLGRKPSILKSEKMNPAFFAKLWDTIVAGEPFRGVFLNQKKNGELYYEDKTISPLKNEQGEITHFVSVGRDRTEQMKAEEEEHRLRTALENAAREWKLTFDAVHSAILITDAEGLVQRLNQAARELLGLSYDDAIGCNLVQFSPAELWGAVNAVLLESREWRQPSSRQILDPKSGKSWYLHVSQFMDPSLDKEHMLITLRDVTALVDLQESVRRSETMSAMGTLVAGVAHEIRNPLFSISATLDAIEARFGVRAEYAEYMRNLRHELSRLSGLMEELLDYGKPAGLDMADTTIEAIVSNAVQTCWVLARKYGVEIVSHVGPDLPLVRVDGRRIAEIFRNVLENAIQHSAKDAKVTIDARTVREEQQTWIECVVKDSGPGFRPEDLPHLFEPFFTRRRGGTGMGLAIVERAIEQHGGKIIARNRPEGGAEMLIRLRARQLA